MLIMKKNENTQINFPCKKEKEKKNPTDLFNNKKKNTKNSGA